MKYKQTEIYKMYSDMYKGMIFNWNTSLSAKRLAFRGWLIVRKWGRVEHSDMASHHYGKTESIRRQKEQRL